ncbi:MAG: hypothetical protein II917_01530 [Synergistaceae bacterium]|nr:hypothetical protein [Synergistaceae bacterium]
MNKKVYVTRRLPEKVMQLMDKKFEYDVSPEERLATREELINGVKNYGAIVTMLNNDWRIDVEKYVKVLNEKAKNGWRLCNVYTNELGKEARRVLGYGINSVVYEDVLIFERRILKGELINYTDK